MPLLPAQAFAKTFGQTPDDLDMHVVYDVSHNIAKVRWSGWHSTAGSVDGVVGKGTSRLATGARSAACRRCKATHDLASNVPSPHLSRGSSPPPLHRLRSTWWTAS